MELAQVEDPLAEPCHPPTLGESLRTRSTKKRRTERIYAVAAAKVSYWLNRPVGRY